ncbi:hypothetical protein PtB15_11B194 [Puccinia triticina]|nr:hypothetical protein PtB15_11B194 [Puccinia triticina]
MDLFGHPSQCPSSLSLDDQFRPLESSNQYDQDPHQQANRDLFYRDYQDPYQQPDPYLDPLLIPQPPEGPALSTQNGGISSYRGVPAQQQQPPPSPHNQTSSTNSAETPATNQSNSAGTPLPTNRSIPDATQNQPSQSDPKLTKPKPPPRSKTPAHLVENVKRMEIDQLISLAAKHAQYVRLTAEDKVELNSAYKEYQRKLYTIAYKNKLAIGPCLRYVGEGANPRGSTCYNSFCRYDPVASKVFTDSTIHPDDCKRECGRLWKMLDADTRDKWKDPEYVGSISVAPDLTNEGDENEHNPPGTHKKRKAASFDSDHWARKVVADLRQLSRMCGTEGFLVIGSRDKDSTLKFSGGSHLGEHFLDMYSTNDDPVTNFIDFLRGQTVIKKLTGKEPPPVVKKQQSRKPKPRNIFTNHDKGQKKVNIDFIRAKLNDAIEKATHGKWMRGWPGTRTQEGLARLQVSLRVKDNDLGVTLQHFCKRPGDMGDKHAQLVVAALEEDWVELIGPPAPDNTGLGGSDGEALKENSSPTIVSVGQCSGVLRPIPKSKGKKQSTQPNKKRKLHSVYNSDDSREEDNEEEDEDDEDEDME